MAGGGRRQLAWHVALSRAEQEISPAMKQAATGIKHAFAFWNNMYSVMGQRLSLGFGWKACV